MNAIIAIVDSNALSAIGMKVVLERIAPMAQFVSFSSVHAMRHALKEEPVHFFISAQALVEDANFFLQRKNRTMVFVNGQGAAATFTGYHTLDVSRGEEQIVHDLLCLMRSAHGKGQHQPPQAQWTEPCGLSSRELEVMRLLAKGYINKEIADLLHISTTTVISHRKNIMDKLQARSVTDLAIYAVVNGYIDIGNGKE